MDAVASMGVDAWLQLIPEVQYLETDVQDFGFLPAILLRFGLFEARVVVDQVREHFIKGDGGLDQAMNFKDSYTPTFNMVGVAGAIIAQIALTALGLSDLDDTHWTARAAFIAGLVAGSLAVFCSCVLQSRMSGLHNARAVRRWLTRPSESFPDLHEFTERLRDWQSDIEKSGIGEDIASVIGVARAQQSLSTTREMLNELHYRPSLSAALIITAPSQLLNVALGSLLTGFGIYFGMVYTARLPTIEDHRSALAALTVYIISTASGLIFFYLPMLFKLAATTREGKKAGLDEAVSALESSIDAAQRRSMVLQPHRTLSALNKMIDIQSEQVKLQKDLLTALETRFGASACPATT